MLKHHRFMKKYNPNDDFFRDVLKDHQIKPSDAAKKAFLRDVAQVAPPVKKIRKGLIFLSALLALMSAGIIFWGTNYDKFSPNPEKGPATSVENSKTIKYTQEAKTRQTNKPSTLPLITPVLSGQNDKNTARAMQSPSSWPSSSPSVTDEKQATISSGDENKQITGETKDEGIAQNVAPLNSLSSDTGSNPMIKKTDSTLVPASATKENTRNRSPKTSAWIPSIGVYYTPEWMFNTLEGTKFVNNFGIEGTFHFGRFSVRTGAGLSVASGSNELIVAYNDFLGTYNKLDSIDFTWNDPIHNYIPKMYTSKKDVWDSLMKLEYAKVAKRYTYLQVPLILGFDFWQSDMVSMGARMGPVMSILLTSKQLSAGYDPGNKRVISINDIAPEQVSLNWQVMAGLNTAIRFTNALQLEVEPSVRYYFNSVYEKPINSNKPWSLGVRAAIVVKF